MSVLFSILLFSFLIFIHELGHFTAAKLFGVRVNEFALFMGPAIWQKQMGETVYSLRTIPIGGYCAMEGEEGDSDNPRSFGKAVWWKRLVILVAGAGMNFVAGVLLLGIFFNANDQFILPTISQVDPQCSFQGEKGIQPGDRLVSLDGERIYVYSDFELILSLNPGDVHDLVLERGEERVVLEKLNMARVPIPNEDGTTSLRFGFSFTLVNASPLQKLRYTWASARDMVRMVRLSFRILFRGQASIADVSGPVGIVKTMSDVASQSDTAYYALMNLLYFGGFLAINLAVMNLMPIPALDGGRVAGLLLTTAIEAVTHRKLNPKYEAYVHSAGMALLLGLMAVIMLKDIIFVFKR